MSAEQIKLLNIADFIKKPVNDGKTGIKRGPYNKNKIVDLNPWEVMSRIYRELSNYCVFPLFSNKTTAIENNGLRLWHTVYTNETYSYFDEEFTGEDFKIIEAEIIGTELMPIEWRLFLHYTLLDFLKDYFTLNDIMPYIHQLMDWYKKDLQLKDLFIYLWTMDCEVKNG